MVAGVTGETVVLVVVVDEGSSSRSTLMQPLMEATATRTKATLMLRKKVIDFIVVFFT